MVDGIDMRDAEEGPPPGADPQTLAATVTWPRGFTMEASGLHWTTQGDEPKTQWIASPFAVEGETRTGAGHG